MREEINYEIFLEKIIAFGTFIMHGSSNIRLCLVPKRRLQ